MSLHREADGTIVLRGNCSVDESEPLHRMLLCDPMPKVDWTGCTQLHSAVLQLILAARPPLLGPCGDAFVERWISDKHLKY